MSTPATPRGSAVSAFVFDLIALLVFAFLARLAHDDGAGFSISRWLDTAWPFLLGGVIVWGVLWFSALGNRTGYEARTAIPVWLTSVIVGLAIWGLRHGAVPHWSFMLVATVMSALLLFGWRLIARVVASR